jgi:hypothetical protein
MKELVKSVQLDNTKTSWTPYPPTNIPYSFPLVPHALRVRTALLGQPHARYVLPTLPRRLAAHQSRPVNVTVATMDRLEEIALSVLSTQSHRLAAPPSLPVNAKVAAGVGLELLAQSA